MRFKFNLLATLLFTLLFACSSAPTKPRVINKAGEPIAVGQVSYAIMNSEWTAELPGLSAPRVPQHKFLVLTATINNGGTADVTVPYMVLEDKDGKEFGEVSDVEGFGEWLGILRPIPPSGTIHGKAVFDVPPGNYLLRVSDGAEQEKEALAYIQIHGEVSGEAPASTPQ